MLRSAVNNAPFVCLVQEGESNANLHEDNETASRPSLIPFERTLNFGFAAAPSELILFTNSTIKFKCRIFIRRCFITARLLHKFSFASLLYRYHNP